MDTVMKLQPRSRDEVLAWLRNAREIKERKQQEAERRYAVRQQRIKDLEKSSYYNFDWWE